MSNNIIEHFEDTTGIEYSLFKSEVFEMLTELFQTGMKDEEYYEECSQMVQDFIGNQISVDYDQLNELSSFMVVQFFSED